VFQAVERGDQIGPHKLINTKVIAAMNPPSGDYTVLDFTDPAFNDRFCHIKFEPTQDEFLSWARGNVNGELIQFLTENKEFIEISGNPLDLTFVKPSRRSAARFQGLLNIGLPQDLAFEVGAGIIGSEASAAFQAYVKNKPKKIDGKLLLNEYAKVKEQVREHNMAMLNLVSDEIIELLKLEETIITEDLVKNVTSFLLDIPADLAISNIIRLIPVENFTNDQITIDKYYNNNPELTLLVREQRKTGVVEKVSNTLQNQAASKEEE